MSLNEDCELQELVKQTLEKSGSMSKIRAELRASVFLALEENGCFQTFTSKNPDLQNFAKTSDGKLIIYLIKDFLDYFGLSFTMSVFEPELASYGIHCDYQDRIQLTNQLNITSDYTKGKEGPLLYCMLQKIRNFQNNISTLKSNSQKTETTSKHLNAETNSVSSVETENIRSPFSRLTSENINADPNKTQLSSNVLQLQTVNEKNVSQSKNSLSSLEDLPPLTSQIGSVKNYLSPLSKSCKQINKLKAILKDTSSESNDTYNLSAIFEDEQMYSTKEEEEETSEIVDSESNNYY